MRKNVIDCGLELLCKSHFPNKLINFVEKHWRSPLIGHIQAKASLHNFAEKCTVSNEFSCEFLEICQES